MTLIRILTQTSTTPATQGFASAYGAVLLSRTNLRTHQGYAYYNASEIELLACLHTLALCRNELQLKPNQEITFVTDHDSLGTHLQRLRQGHSASAVEAAIWKQLQHYADDRIAFASGHHQITADVEHTLQNELLEGTLQALNHLKHLNQKISVFCARTHNQKTLLFAQRLIETAISQQLTLYLAETTGEIFATLIQQAIQHRVPYTIVGSQHDITASVYLHAGDPARWLAQHTSRAYGIATAHSLPQERALRAALRHFENRHKSARLLAFAP